MENSQGVHEILVRILRKDTDTIIVEVKDPDTEFLRYNIPKLFTRFFLQVLQMGWVWGYLLVALLLRRMVEN